MCHDFRLHKIFRLSMESVCIFKCVSRFGQQCSDRALKMYASSMLLFLHQQKERSLLLKLLCNRNASNMQTVKLFEWSALHGTFFSSKKTSLKLEVCHAKTNFLAGEIDASGLFPLLMRLWLRPPYVFLSIYAHKVSRQFINVYCKIDMCNNVFLVLAATAAYK